MKKAEGKMLALGDYEILYESWLPYLDPINFGNSYIGFSNNEKFMKNTKHGTLIVATFTYITFIQLKIDSQN